MIIYVSYSRGTKAKTIQQINKLGKFLTITPLKENRLKLETKTAIKYTETQKIKSLETRFLKISTITKENLKQ